jgi:hypothetical protein
MTPVLASRLALSAGSIPRIAINRFNENKEEVSRSIEARHIVPGAE